MDFKYKKIKHDFWNLNDFKWKKKANYKVVNISEYANNFSIRHHLKILNICTIQLTNFLTTSIGANTWFFYNGKQNRQWRCIYTCGSYLLTRIFISTSAHILPSAGEKKQDYVCTVDVSDKLCLPRPTLFSLAPHTDHQWVLGSITLFHFKDQYCINRNSSVMCTTFGCTAKPTRAC